MPKIDNNEDVIRSKLEEFTLLMLYLQSWKETIKVGTNSDKKMERIMAWKGYDFDTLDKLYEKDFIRGGRKAKSVLLTEDGIGKAKEILKQITLQDDLVKKKGFAWLEKVGNGEWKFDFSMEKWQSDEPLDIAIESMYSNPEEAAEVFRALIEKYPCHFDAYHHLALIEGHNGNFKEALHLRKTAVENGFALFPKEFDFTKDKLEWGWIESRPFLRVLHGLAIDYRNVGGDVKKAMESYEQLLKFDPEDYQGCRSNVVGCYLELKLADKILTLAKKYKNDFSSPEVACGEALACLMLGKENDARMPLAHIIKEFPNVAKQIVDTEHKKPKTRREMKGYIEVGGKDQAYYYWEEFGKYWEGTPGAIALVKTFMGAKRVGTGFYG